VGCRKHSPGNPCDCIPPDCEFVEADLPTVNITGMTEATGWLFFNSGDCCIASKRFTFDVTQDDIVLDGGDVLTWDKTEVCKTEAFCYDKQCGTVTQVFWQQTDPNGRGAILEDESDEPAYNCDCGSPTFTQVHTLTKTVRQRGGRRFVVTVHPTAIWVSFQKTSSYVCSPSAAVTRWIMRSYVYYDGSYSYIDYGELTTTYTSTANTTCWEWPADASSGDYPWDIAGASNVTAFTDTIDSSGIVCRQKVLTTIPTTETSYTFNDGDTHDTGCTQPCEQCDESDLCFASDDLGDDEPTAGFCEATIVTTATDSAYTLQLCEPHYIYFWAETGTCNTLFENMFPDAAPNQMFIQDATICCTRYFTDTAFPYYTTAYLDAICTIPAYDYPSWDTLTAGSAGSGILTDCDYPTLKAGQVIEDCWPTQTCAACPTSTQTGDSNQNLVVATTTRTVLKSIGARIVELTRTVSCSGYTPVEACVTFEAWTIILQEGL